MMFRKETIFEGYFVAYWETACILKDFDLPKRQEGWFREYLKQLLDRETHPYGVYFDDLLPKQVYEKALRNPRTKFRFKIVVEAEEI